MFVHIKCMRSFVCVSYFLLLLTKLMSSYKNCKLNSLANHEANEHVYSVDELTYTNARPV